MESMSGTRAPLTAVVRFGGAATSSATSGSPTLISGSSGPSWPPRSSRLSTGRGSAFAERIRARGLPRPTSRGSATRTSVASRWTGSCRSSTGWGHAWTSRSGWGAPGRAHWAFPPTPWPPLSWGAPPGRRAVRRSGAEQPTAMKLVLRSTGSGPGMSARWWNSTARTGSPWPAGGRCSR
jgi:hypothetical protein